MQLACYPRWELIQVVWTRHQCKSQIPLKNRGSPRLHPWQLQSSHHRRLFDALCPSTMSVSLSCWLWWPWCDNTLLPVIWVGQALCCVLPKDLYNTGQCPRIYRGLWHLLAVRLQQLLVPFSVVVKSLWVWGYDLGILCWWQRKTIFGRWFTSPSHVVW